MTTEGSSQDQSVDVLAPAGDARGLGELELSAAIQQVRARLVDQPGDLWLHRELADLLLKAGNWRDAIPVLRQVIEARPDKINWIRQLATALMHEGEDEGALSAWREVLSAEPDNNHALKRIIELLYRLGRPSDAVADLDTAAAARPEDPAVKRRLAKLTSGERELQARPPVPFHLTRRHRIRPVSEVLRQAPTPDELRSDDNVFHVLDPGGEFIERRPILELDGCGPSISMAYRTAPKFVASIRNAALVGRGIVLTEEGSVIQELRPPSAPRKYGVIERGSALHFDRRWFNDRTLPIDSFDEPAFLMTGPTEAAFGDWIINFGPRLALARAAGLDCRIVVRHRLRHRALEMLEALGVARDRILFHWPHRVSVFPKLYVPSWPNGDKAAPMAGLFGVYKDLPIRPARGRARKLYLTRERLRLRPMLNEREVRELFIRRGFQVVDPGELSHDETREVFSSVACLAGPYGSAFHNLVFCGRPVRNLVLMPPHRPHHLTETMVWHAEHDQTFSYIQGEPVTEALDDTRWTAPLDRVEKALNAVLHALGEAEA